MTQESSTPVSFRRSARFLGAALFALALVAGAWLRFARIGIKPLHHDEGVNAFFLMRLARDGYYAYDPNNYHGPTLYYFALAALQFLGETDLALRFWPAAFGLMTIGALWWLRREMGWTGFGAAGLLVALSPGLVYFSRDFIHEMSFGFFTLGLVAGARRYAETKKFTPLACASACAGLLFATKETAIITVVVLALALVFATLWDLARRFGFGALPGEFMRELRSVLPGRDHMLAAAVIFVFINIIFYSSFFTNPGGVIDAFRSIAHWATERSGKDHVHDFDYYFGILFKIELPLFAGGLLAGAVILWKGTRWGLFLGAWTLGITLAYSLIPYKTPWLLVNMLVPLPIAIGYAVDELARAFDSIAPRMALAALCLTAFVVSWQTAREVNFERYDDNNNETGYLAAFGKSREWRPYTDTQYGYVYAQTDREFLDLVRAIEQEASRQPAGDKTGVLIASPAYWPMPWYLRRYTGVAYTGNLPGDVVQPLMVANATQMMEIEQRGGWRAATPLLALRPGERLLLYVKEQGETTGQTE
jgi:uncharacterized protein (TIGR03663 family)